MRRRDRSIRITELSDSHETPVLLASVRGPTVVLRHEGPGPLHPPPTPRAARAQPPPGEAPSAPAVALPGPRSRGRGAHGGPGRRLLRSGPPPGGGGQHPRLRDAELLLRRVQPAAWVPLCREGGGRAPCRAALRHRKLLQRRRG